MPLKVRGTLTTRGEELNRLTAEIPLSQELGAVGSNTVEPMVILNGMITVLMVVPVRGLAKGLVPSMTPVRLVLSFVEKTE